MHVTECMIGLICAAPGHSHARLMPRVSSHHAAVVYFGEMNHSTLRWGMLHTAAEGLESLSVSLARPPLSLGGCSRSRSRARRLGIFGKHLFGRASNQLMRGSHEVAENCLHVRAGIIERGAVEGDAELYTVCSYSLEILYDVSLASPCAGEDFGVIAVEIRWTAGLRTKYIQYRK